jgi:hypothetical protein
VTLQSLSLTFSETHRPEQASTSYRLDDVGVSGIDVGVGARCIGSAHQSSCLVHSEVVREVNVFSY